MQQRMANAQAVANMVKESILTELGTNPKISTENAPESGMSDEWKFTDMPPDIQLAIIDLDLIGVADNSWEVSFIVDRLIHSLPALNGKRANLYGQIAIASFSGGGKNKIMKHHGVLARTFQGKSEFEEVNPSESEE